METLKVEMGDNTGAGEESWEGLGAKDKEGVDKENTDKGKGMDKGKEGVDKSEGKDTRADLVSATFS